MLDAAYLSPRRFFCALYMEYLPSLNKSTYGFCGHKYRPTLRIALTGASLPAAPHFLGRHFSRAKTPQDFSARENRMMTRKRTPAYWRMSRTITRQTAAQSGPQACVPLSTDAKGSTARSKKTPGQLWPGEDGVVGFGGGLGRCQGYEVRSHWISCIYKIAPAEGKVCRTLSRRNFFPRAATLLAIGYIY